MPKKFLINHFSATPTTAFARESIAASLEKLKTDRKVRKVVTPSGHRVRGNFTSLKAGTNRLRFESGLEATVLALLEVARSVTTIKTHPYVLSFTTTGIHYTPDVEVTTSCGIGLIEAKGDIYLHSNDQRKRLRAIDAALSDAGIPFVVVLSSDLKSTPICATVTELLRERPWPKHGTRGHVPDEEIAGLQSSLCTSDFIQRWQAAGNECDALLNRLLSRGVDDSIAAAQ